MKIETPPFILTINDAGFSVIFTAKSYILTLEIYISIPSTSIYPVSNNYSITG